jgi:ABC-type Na+ efflux pump permease subunit
MSIKKILAILKKDFQDGLKNYHIILMVLTPVILSLLFSKLITTSADSEAGLPEFGFISSPQQPFINELIKKGMKNKITFYQDQDSLETALLEGKVKFGVILPEIISDKSDNNKSVTLLYPPSIPDFAAETLRASIETMFREQLGITPAPLPFDLKVKPIANPRGTGGLTDNMFPMLILMAIGVIGFLALPMSIVEEREKGTLNAIFLTPIKPSEFIIGKSLFSFILISITIALILTLNGKWSDNSPHLFLISMIGALMTIFIGLIIANFAQSQGTVNSIGTIFFLIFQLVPTLQSTSSSIDSIAHFIPSTYIFSGVKKTLYLDLTKVNMQFDLTCVVTFAIFFYIITYLIYKFKKAD